MSSFCQSINNRLEETHRDSVSPDEKFNALLKESFESTIRTVLGETAGAALLFYVDFSSVPDPMLRLASLRTVMGLGSPVIEKLMLSDLYGKLNLTYDGQENPDLETEVERARTVFEEKEEGGRAR